MGRHSLAMGEVCGRIGNQRGMFQRPVRAAIGGLIGRRHGFVLQDRRGTCGTDRKLQGDVPKTLRGCYWRVNRREAWPKGPTSIGCLVRPQWAEKVKKISILQG